MADNQGAEPLPRRVLFRSTNFSDGAPTHEGWVRGVEENEPLIWALTFPSAPCEQSGPFEGTADVGYAADGRPVWLRFRGQALSISHAQQCLGPRISQTHVPHVTGAVRPEVSALLQPGETATWIGEPDFSPFLTSISVVLGLVGLLTAFGLAWARLAYVGLSTSEASERPYLLLFFMAGCLVFVPSWVWGIRKLRRLLRLRGRIFYLITDHRACVVIVDPPRKVIEYLPNDIYFACIKPHRRRQRVSFPSKGDPEGDFWGLSPELNLVTLLGGCLRARD